MIQCPGDTITTIDLPGAAAPHTAVAGPDMSTDRTVSYRDYVGAVLRSAEERYLLRMLKTYRGNINQIAKLMEVDRKTVYRKLAEHGINVSDFR
jgi:transcriptional regulator of acetoin/glycerol metabolism